MFLFIHSLLFILVFFAFIHLLICFCVFFSIIPLFYLLFITFVYSFIYPSILKKKNLILSLFSCIHSECVFTLGVCVYTIHQWFVLLYHFFFECVNCPFINRKTIQFKCYSLSLNMYLSIKWSAIFHFPKHWQYFLTTSQMFCLLWHWINAIQKD